VDIQALLPTLRRRESAAIHTRLHNFLIVTAGVAFAIWPPTQIPDAMDLCLPTIRRHLIRQEETIIFALIERAQWQRNARVYQAGEKLIPDDSLSFFDYFLRETERLHARVRRYTSPDEHPFFDDLPDPVLAPMDFEPSIQLNSVNHNAVIKQAYLERMLPLICDPGDDGNYGSSATCDVAAVQALSKRIHFGKFVAEAKLRADREGYMRLIHADDRDGIAELLRNRAVEARILQRVALKAATFGQDIDETPKGDSHKICPEAIVEIYQSFIIPQTIAVEVDYLMAVR
jgi:chorismate mutase